MKVFAKISTTAISLMLAFVLLLRGNLLWGRLAANGRPGILYSLLQRSSTDPAVLAVHGTAYWLAGYCTEAAESYAAAAKCNLTTKWKLELVLLTFASLLSMPVWSNPL